jgi:hypothetical protein
MVDGLHIPIQNRTKKPLAIDLSGAGSWALVAQACNPSYS